MTTLVFPGNSFQTLRKELLSHSPDEACAVLVARHSWGAQRERLLVADAQLVPEASYQAKSRYRAVIGPQFLAPILKQARSEGNSLFMVHTHPFSGGRVDFSSVDDEGERVLMPSLHARAPSGLHGSLVLGQTEWRARVWRSAEGPAEEIMELVECGRDLRLHGQDAEKSPDSLYERNVRALGALGQARLASLRVAIVGLGGTGSIVAEQLAHLGVRDFLLLDPDRLELSNLNRVVGGRASMVGMPKVAVAENLIRGIRQDVEVVTCDCDVLDPGISKILLDADLIMGCTDSHGSRALLNQIAYQHMVPVIDMGVRIDATDGLVSAVSGRVQLLAPGLPCLVCQNTLDPEEVRRDFLTSDARARDPYIVGDPQPQPSVITLNGTVCSLATTMVLAVVAGFPSTARHQVLVGLRGVVRSIESAPVETCVVCSRSGAFARGDLWPLPARPR